MTPERHRNLAQAAHLVELMAHDIIQLLTDEDHPETDPMRAVTRIAGYWSRIPAADLPRYLAIRPEDL